MLYVPPQTSTYHQLLDLVTFLDGKALLFDYTLLSEDAIRCDCTPVKRHNRSVWRGPEPSLGTTALHSSKKRGTNMVILQIEHPVPNFDAWKKAFDSDPVNRKQSGVRRYQVLRPIDNPNYAIIDLEFDSVNEAEGLLAAMREVWRGVQGTIMESPRVRIVEAVESKEL